MENAEYIQFLSFLNQDSLKSYIETELSYQNHREILLFDCKVYDELFQYFGVEQTWVAKHEEFIVLEQCLMDASRKELTQLIEKIFSYEQVINILISLKQ